MSGFEDMDDEDIKRYQKMITIWETMEKLRKEGKTYQEISKIVGWDHETVQIYMKTHGFLPKDDDVLV